MSKKSLRKGKRVEYLIRDMLRDLGQCERVPCSGNAKAIKGDLILTLPTGEKFYLEVKARKDGFKQLYDFFQKALDIYSSLTSSTNIYSGLIVKIDKKQPLVVIDLETFKKLVRGIDVPKKMS